VSCATNDLGGGRRPSENSWIRKRSKDTENMTPDKITLAIINRGEPMNTQIIHDFDLRSPSIYERAIRRRDVQSEEKSTPRTTTLILIFDLSNLDQSKPRHIETETIKTTTEVRKSCCRSSKLVHICKGHF
jgi:hypothetical protein